MARTASWDRASTAWATRPSPASYVLASKDVYSSRYFDASLSLAIASVAAADPFHPVIFVLHHGGMDEDVEFLNS